MSCVPTQVDQVNSIGRLSVGLFVNNLDDIVAGSPEDFAAFIKSEMARMGKMIQAAGLRDE